MAQPSFVNIFRPVMPRKRFEHKGLRMLYRCNTVVTTLNSCQNGNINLQACEDFASKNNYKIKPLTKSHRNKATERMWATVTHKTNEKFYQIKFELSLPEGITTPFTNIWLHLCVNSFMDFQTQLCRQRFSAETAYPGFWHFMNFFIVRMKYFFFLKNTITHLTFKLPLGLWFVL